LDDYSSILFDISSCSVVGRDILEVTCKKDSIDQVNQNLKVKSQFSILMNCVHLIAEVHLYL